MPGADPSTDPRPIEVYTNLSVHALVHTLCDYPSSIIITSYYYSNFYSAQAEMSIITKMNQRRVVYSYRYYRTVN